MVAEEKHKNGDDHRHVYLRLKAPYDTRDAKFADLVGVEGDTVRVYHGNYQGCRSDKNVIKYCTKADDYLASFDVSQRLEARARKKKEDLIKLRDGGSLKDLVKEDASYLSGYKKLKLDKLEHDNDNYMPVVRKMECFWLYGPTGHGKTTKAFAMCGCDGKEGSTVKDTYLKPSNSKWWDGYEGEKNVIIDELPKEFAGAIINSLKIWSDRWPHKAEVKGGTVWLRHEKLIVTCQHSIETFFEGCKKEDIDAVKRRFSEEQIIDLNKMLMNPQD